MERRLWFLKGCDLFENLTPEQAQRLESHALFRAFKRNTLIYSPSDAGQSVMVLAKGRVKIKDITPDGKETILAFIEAGEMFGELAILDSEPRQDYAETVVDSEVVVVPRENMLWLMQTKPDVSLYITKLIGWRRRRIENRLRNVLFLPSRDRMIRLLNELMDAHGNRQGNRCELRLALSHQELASLVGVTRETVTTVLGHLQAEGLIEIQRRHIVVADCAALELMVNG
jgi:CRP/FNR family cyclic AMP-dependent transcriptional regulator